MTVPTDDVRAGMAAIARALGVRVPDEDLRALAPAVEAVWAGLARLRQLPIDGCEPAFRPPAGGGDVSAGEGS